MMTEGGAARGMDLMLDSGLMQILLPEVVPMRRMRAAREFPSRGRRVHAHADCASAMLTAGCTETARVRNPAARYRQAEHAARCIDGKVTFYGHTDDGAVMAAEILARLKRSRAVQERVAYLVKNHLRLCMAPRMRPSTLKRMLAEDGFDELMEVALHGRDGVELVPRASSISAAAR